MGGGCLTRGIAQLSSADRCIISLLRNGDHALLTLEGYKDNTHTIWMEVYDFLPKGRLEVSKDTGKLCNILQNPTTEGQVRARSVENSGSYTGEEVWRMFKFQDDGPDAEYLYWEVSSDDYKKIKANIKKDIQNPPKFSIGGKDRVLFKEGHNCYTWAKERLSVIDITIESSIWDKLIAAQPIKHIQLARNSSSCVLC